MACLFFQTEVVYISVWIPITIEAINRLYWVRLPATVNPISNLFIFFSGLASVGSVIRSKPVNSSQVKIKVILSLSINGFWKAVPVHQIANTIRNIMPTNRAYITLIILWRVSSGTMFIKSLILLNAFSFSSFKVPFLQRISNRMSDKITKIR